MFSLLQSLQVPLTLGTEIAGLNAEAHFFNNAASSYGPPPGPGGGQWQATKSSKLEQFAQAGSSGGGGYGSPGGGMLNPGMQSGALQAEAAGMQAWATAHP